MEVLWIRYVDIRNVVDIVSMHDYALHACTYCIILSYGVQGYDISDFHDIDPLFGSMQVRSVRHRLALEANPSESLSQDFKDLVAAAKEIGISLLMETRHKKHIFEMISNV